MNTPTMQDALDAGDGVLHNTIDALQAERDALRQFEDESKRLSILLFIARTERGEALSAFNTQSKWLEAVRAESKVLRQQLEAESKAAAHWMQEANAEHNKTVRLTEQFEAAQKDGERIKFIAIYGSFGCDSVSGAPGGNGQKRLAATQKNIDAAIAATKGTT